MRMNNLTVTPGSEEGKKAESAQTTITRQSLNGQGKKLESRIKPHPNDSRLHRSHLTAPI